MDWVLELAENANTYTPLGPTDERIVNDRYVLWMGRGDEPGWNVAQRFRLQPGEVDEVRKDGKELKVRFGLKGEGSEATADVVLLAAGRTPYTEGLGLDAAGVEVVGKRVKVDDHLRTSTDGIWAIGDVIGGIMLAHVASYEGVCAVENIAGGGDRVPDYHAAPNCV